MKELPLRHIERESRPIVDMPAIQARMLLRDQSFLNPNMIEAPILTAQTTCFLAERDYSLFEAASLGERKLMQQDSGQIPFDERYRTWSTSVLRRFNSEANKQRMEILKPLLGITGELVDETDIQRLYNRYLNSGSSGTGLKTFVRDIIGNYEAQTVYDMDTFIHDRESIKWVSQLFGSTSSEMIDQLITAEMKLLSNPDRCYETLNRTRNIITEPEKKMMTFISGRETVEPPRIEPTHENTTHRTISPITSGSPSREPSTPNQTLYTAEFTRQTATALGRCGVDIGYINPVPIGKGANHVVFEVNVPGQNRKVLKIGKPSTITTMTEGHIGEQEGYTQATSYFTDKYIPKTEVYKDPRTDFYCVLQNAIKGRKITNLTLRDRPDLLAQLMEIVLMNNRLYKEKKISLDFIGMEGFVGWLEKQSGKLLLRKSEFPVSNILVDEDDNLKIIDFEFFDLSHKVGFKRGVLNWFGMTANRVLMKHYFGLDILK